MDNLFTVAEQFKPSGSVIDVREFGSGNINNTFLVTLESEGEKNFVLQRINTKVFRRPELVMQNLRVSTEHIHSRLEHAPLSAGRRWEVPRVVLTRDGR
ncbi:MAG: aminoglycoside phosphotransferase, partial [Nitrospirota bacterium]|nr:aminoglycoside phosphotransferase [Nitrospirota bacterium]